jgi:hypothetical protein
VRERAPVLQFEAGGAIEPVFITSGGEIDRAPAEAERTHFALRHQALPADSSRLNSASTVGHHPRNGRGDRRHDSSRTRRAGNMAKSGASKEQSASELISDRIAELGDWRGEALARMRKLIKQADPDVVEEWKWMGTPIWSHDGIICRGESYKTVVKLTFAKGASLSDPRHLFNSSLEGNMRRAIDIHEGEQVDASAFKGLIRQAIALNVSDKAKKPKSKARSKARSKPRSKARSKAKSKPKSKTKTKAKS